jgi:cytochrome c
VRAAHVPPRRRRFELAARLFLAASVGACSQDQASAALGDAADGERVLLRAGCGACHRISGIPGARGAVGPSLDGLAARQYLAGSLPNVPENLVRWLMHPEQLKPETVMPDTGLDERQARDVAARLSR